MTGAWILERLRSSETPWLTHTKYNLLCDRYDLGPEVHRHPSKAGVRALGGSQYQEHTDRAYGLFKSVLAIVPPKTKLGCNE